MTREQDAVGLKRASRVTDGWLRPPAAAVAGFTLWISALHCQQSWGYCSEWGCATGTSLRPDCSTVAGVGVEPWALGVISLLTAICVFAGVHRI